MGSSSKRVADSPCIIVVDDRSYSSASTSSYDTMSSHSSYSGLSAGSNSYSSGSSSADPSVIHGQFRDSKAGGYTVDYHRRTGGRDVSVFNYHATGHEDGAPHPGYGNTSRREDTGK